MTDAADSHADSAFDDGRPAASMGAASVSAGSGDSASTARAAGDAAGKRRPSKSYVVPVTSAFRDAVTALADSRNVSPADLARAVLLTVDEAMLTATADPGEPDREDREVVVVRSGISNGRTLRRKPRLQVRLDTGLSLVRIRKALRLALEHEQGIWTAGPAEAIVEAVAPEVDPALVARAGTLQDELNTALGEVERLYDVVRSLSFMPLPSGVRTRAEALYVLGFPPSHRPDQTAVKERFRLLAKVHHPDSPIGDTVRMAQLNEAMLFLKGSVGRFPF